MKTLVLYYSQSGTTKMMAEEIAQTLEGSCEAIRLKKPFKKKSPLLYVLGGFQAGFKVKKPILPLENSPQNFDLIVIGTPVWNKQMVPAVRTFLSEGDYAGKKVAVFCTMGGNQQGLFKDAAELIRKKGAAMSSTKSFVSYQVNVETLKKAASDWAKSVKA